MPTQATQAKVLRAIGDVPRADWDALVGPDTPGAPFVRHAWLGALEESGCASPKTSFTPRHLTLWRGARLVAAAPAWIRDDSDGDFARDWDLASAAERAGARYYPKLSLTVPYTPVTGRRLLTAPGEPREPLVRELLAAARELAREEGCASAQVLFPDAAEASELSSIGGLSVRMSYQYHWRNQGYREPADFLARLSSKRRHQQKRERAAPATQGITLRTVRGDELAADPMRWARAAHALHESTVDKLVWGRRWLNRDFYERVFASLTEHVEVVAAERDGRLVAGAFNVATRTHLYGRYWGCFEEHPFLHFNVCLYHSIDDCIRRGIEVFEGGAGGEHKLARGFEPAETYSAYLFLDARLDAAFRRHLDHERARVAEALERFRAETPIVRKSA